MDFNRDHGPPPSIENRRSMAPALGALRGLTARILIAELWLGIGAMSFVCFLDGRDPTLPIALATLIALVPSLFWVCDPTRLMSRYALSLAIVIQCTILAVLTVGLPGPVIYGVFAFSLVLLAQTTGFLCWRSLVLAGALLITVGVTAEAWAATVMAYGAEVVRALLDGLLPLWLLALAVLLPMAYRIERAMVDAHVSRLVALGAMTKAVEEARSVSAESRALRDVADAEVPLRRTAIRDAGGESGAVSGQIVPGASSGVEAGAGTGPGLATPRRATGNPVHWQQAALVRALETRDEP